MITLSAGFQHLGENVLKRIRCMFSNSKVFGLLIMTSEGYHSAQNFTFVTFTVKL